MMNFDGVKVDFEDILFDDDRAIFKIINNGFLIRANQRANYCTETDD